MNEVDSRIADATEVLRQHGAVFAYLHGSRASGAADAQSDVDIAAYFDEPHPEAFEVLLPVGVDLVILNHAPLELTGRIALQGKLLFERDPDARVVWEATTRKIYFDELPRMMGAHRDFAEAVLCRGG
ncbi:MAG: DNA polymerase III subunit beta [Mycobacterium sp.]|uniref:type VII toxin-antitoxin system MntA family adenylyltransferase antitoxin n=1 Tax=Mycobacterium sp. TaxID=1785 RepID=UPI000CBB1BFA|nr:nucleotidyltransferase domain-containing protein [Mycobacterium sp.]PJE04441.1 MAG: DNA polymerase III subunit beta [Mycobacterium sp.]PJE09664.1 MAG: DNA polymerase III subunit beta [Mycobacterium sp.]